jgi:spermidine synthase
MTKVGSSFLCFIHGFVGIICQLILLRELPQIFYGNEISFGIILTSWLFWAALGSIVGGQFSSRVKSHVIQFVYMSIASALFTCVILVSIRYIRPVFGFMPGEIISVPFILGITALFTLPIAFLQGWLFTILPAFLSHVTLKQSVNTVYMLESLGAFLGCIAYYCVGLPLLNSFQCIFYILTIRFFVLSTFLIKKREFRKVTLHVSILATCFLLLIPFSNQLNSYFYKKAYSPLSIIDSIESQYGTLIVTKQNTNSLSFFENGLLLFTSDDTLLQEEITQIPMLSHPSPKHVLLLGGGITGCLQPIFAHPTVESVTYVEIDAHLVSLALKHASREKKESLTDSRLKIVNEDPRIFLQKNSNLFDVIISTYPQPYTLQINRFYSAEFFNLIKKSLTHNGIFSFVVPSSESFINNEQAVILKTLKGTLDSAFPFTSIVPGNFNIFIASLSTVNTITAESLMREARERKLSLEYINEFYLPSRLSPENNAYLNGRINAVQSELINYDLNPILYFHTFRLWAQTSFKSLSPFIDRVNQIEPSTLYTFVSIVFFILITISLRTQNASIPLIATVGAVGLTELSLEIIIILLVQIFIGNSYSFMAIIIAAYMSGLTFGACISNYHAKYTLSKKAVFIFLIAIECCMILFPLVLLLFPHLFTFLSYSLIKKQIAFVAISIATGTLGGMQFPFANALYLQNVSSQNKHTGTMYAIDLLGSSVGAFFITLFIIPLFGITQTLCFLSFIHLLCVFSLGFASKFLKS